MLVKLVKLVLRKDGPGWVVRIREINDFGPRVDCRGPRLQIVMPISVWDRPVRHAARFRQNLKSDKRGFSGEHLILIAQKSADDVGHDAFRATARDYVFNL